MAIKEEVLETARNRPKVFRVGEGVGSCSKCGWKIHEWPVNFCNGCGGTFLSTEQIEKGELLDANLL